MLQASQSFTARRVTFLGRGTSETYLKQDEKKKKIHPSHLPSWGDTKKPRLRPPASVQNHRSVVGSNPKRVLDSAAVIPGTESAIPLPCARGHNMARRSRTYKKDFLIDTNCWRKSRRRPRISMPCSLQYCQDACTIPCPYLIYSS